MAFTHDELDRMVDETRHRGMITGDVYCGNCGYNLKTLPYVYQCPECGNEYRARRLFPRGIFCPSQALFPFWGLIATVVVAALAVLFSALAFWGWYTLPRTGLIVVCGLAVLLGLTAVRVGRESVRALALYRKECDVGRRIAEQEKQITDGFA